MIFFYWKLIYEYTIIKKHPLIGYDLLKDMNIDERIKKAALMHHERCDGSGYPQKIKEEKINRNVGRDVLKELFENDIDPKAYVEEKGLILEDDTELVAKIIDDVIAEFPQSVADYKGGKEKAIGFLVGQTMKAMKGKADPGSVNEILREVLAQQ